MPHECESLWHMNYLIIGEIEEIIQTTRCQCHLLQLICGSEQQITFRKFFPCHWWDADSCLHSINLIPQTQKKQQMCLGSLSPSDSQHSGTILSGACWFQFFHAISLLRHSTPECRGKCLLVNRVTDFLRKYSWNISHSFLYLTHWLQLPSASFIMH